ncbi:hypothetical protein H8959_007154 [Pygathrix nigripes]
MANPKNETRTRAVQCTNSALPRSSGPTRRETTRRGCHSETRVTCGKSPRLPLPPPPSRHSNASMKSASAGAPEIRHGNVGCV